MTAVLPGKCVASLPSLSPVQINPVGFGMQRPSGTEQLLHKLWVHGVEGFRGFLAKRKVNGVAVPPGELQRGGGEEKTMTFALLLL